MIRKMAAYFLLVLWIILISIIVAILVRVDTGLGPWDAMALTFSFLTGIKVGTVGMIFNFLCVFGQIALLGKKYRKINLLQIPISILLGNTINFFLYNVFSNLSFESYIIRIALTIIIIILLSFMIGGIVALGLPTFSLEGFCLAIYKKIGIPFSKIRQRVDFFCVGTIIAFTLIFRVKWTLREGTLMSMLLFGPLLGIFTPWLEKVYKRLGIIEVKGIKEKIDE